MAAGFRTRKLKSEQSIGDQLKRARVRQKKTVAEAEEATKIRSKFILALESDSWDQIPSEVYGRGYLEAYAAYLKLSVPTLMKKYEKGRAMYRRQCVNDSVSLAPTMVVRPRSFLITPRMMTVSLGVVAALGFGLVVANQVRNFVSAPYLELVPPAEAQVLGVSQLAVSNDTYTVEGHTVSGATVKVNSQPIAVQEDGSFTQPVPVQHGMNAVVVEATNPAGKTSTETLSVVVR